MLIYIHVPFCRSKCRYCAFHSEVMNLEDAQSAREAMQSWLDTLLLEIAHWGDKLEKPPVRTVFFGGGTPSLAPPDIIALIMNRLRRSFKLDAKAEVSMEANPESISLANAKGYFRAGVNRVSLGVQSFNDEQLAFLGRPHTVNDALKAYNALRTANFHNVGLDLIWGLPGQSRRQWLKQLEEVIRLRPDHLSCYGLTLEEGTPFELMFQEGLLEMPQEREQAAMFMQGSELLEEAGFMHYEVSNFARMGYLCRHNLGYWDGEDYLGLGPSAVSTLQGRRWTNPSSRHEWGLMVRRGEESPNVEVLTGLDRVLELVMLRLRTTRGLRVKAYKDLTGRDFLHDNKTLVHTLHKNGLVRIRHGYLRLTRNGLLVSNSIIEHFFSSTKEKLALMPEDWLVSKSLNLGDEEQSSPLSEIPAWGE